MSREAEPIQCAPIRSMCSIAVIPLERQRLASERPWTGPCCGLVLASNTSRLNGPRTRATDMLALHLCPWQPAVTWPRAAGEPQREGPTCV